MIEGKGDLITTITDTHAETIALALDQLTGLSGTIQRHYGEGVYIWYPEISQQFREYPDFHASIGVSRLHTEFPSFRKHKVTDHFRVHLSPEVKELLDREQVEEHLKRNFPGFLYLGVYSVWVEKLYMLSQGGQKEKQRLDLLVLLYNKVGLLQLINH